MTGHDRTRGVLAARGCAVGLVLGGCLFTAGTLAGLPPPVAAALVVAAALGVLWAADQVAGGGACG